MSHPAPLWKRLARRTIWSPDQIDPDDWKYRSLTRVWLPIFDLICIISSAWAFMYGSPILHKLFPQDGLIQMLATGFFVVTLSCFVAVIFPALWRLEIFAKIGLMSLLAGYGASILLLTSPPDWFPAFVILTTLPLPFFRLSLLGEEIKERRARAALLDLKED
jgi:hypothetical protein